MTFTFYKDKEDFKNYSSGFMHNLVQFLWKLKASILSHTDFSNADIPLWEMFSESLPPVRENWCLAVCSPIFSDLKCSSLLGRQSSSDLALNHFWLFLKECARIKKKNFLMFGGNITGISEDLFKDPV